MFFQLKHGGHFVLRTNQIRFGVWAASACIVSWSTMVLNTGRVLIVDIVTKLITLKVTRTTRKG